VEQCSSYHTGSKCFRNNGLLYKPFKKAMNKQ
jgi:hypothetical protein